jgi:hypothetical protein
MTSSEQSAVTGPDRAAFIMWDMAGTLIPFDPVTGKPQVLPGCGDFLPELNRRFRQVVTTGDGTASARALLDSCGLLPYLEGVFGDLGHPVGKPYGEILDGLGGDPTASLAVGDRLRNDIPADTPDLVTVLINQHGDMINAGMVAYMIHILGKHAGHYPQAFRLMTANAAPDPAAVGDTAGGRITGAWKRNDGFEYSLWTFEHSALAGERLVIVI